MTRKKKVDLNSLEDHDLLILTAQTVTTDIPAIKTQLKKLNGRVSNNAEGVIKVNGRVDGIIGLCHERSEQFYDLMSERFSRKRKAAYIGRDIGLAAGVIVAILRVFEVIG